MMNIDFSSPMRQSFRGIFIIFIAGIFKNLRQNIYLLGLPFISQNVRENYLLYLIIGAILLIVFQLVFSYLSYLKFQFYIDKDSFRLHHGVFKRSDVEIPFERIQNINIEQNLLQQLLNVVGFEVETAGEGNAEIKIKALDRKVAVALKEKLLEEKQEVLSESSISTEDTTDFDDSDVAKNTTDLLFKLNFSNLLKVGVCSNFFKGMGVLFIFIGTIYNFVNDILKRFFEIDFEENFFQRIPETLTFVAIFGVIFVFLGFLITLVSTMVKYFGLRVVRVKNNFEVEYGLIKRVNQVIKKNKTQVVKIDTNPLRKFFNINNVFVSQASSEELTEKNKIGMVGIANHHFKEFFEAIFELDYQQEYTTIRTSYRLMIRLFWKQLIFVVGAASAAYFFLSFTSSLLVGGLVLVVLSLLNFLLVKKSYLSINEDL
ncbi:MAG: PH domain-containing protein, partial [Bacteroidota bacterium]